MRVNAQASSRDGTPASKAIEHARLSRPPIQHCLMLELEAAVERILAALPPPVPETVPLSLAHRRILAEKILSPVDLPGFDNSSMDGYAVRAADLQHASAAAPVSLRLHGRVAAGETFAGELAPGDCIRIFTGSPLPRGADAVIMQEDSRTNSTTPGVVQFLDSVKPWDNVRFRGGDVKSGASIGEPGDSLHAGRLNLLAAAGLASVRVGRRTVTGLLAAGSELLEPGQPPAPGKIYESNRAGLAALTVQAGAEPKIFPIIRETLADTRAALETAFQTCDILVTSGGVSVGEMDFIKDAFTQLGGTLDFWKVAIRPGRPFAFGCCSGKFLFALPGNPVSAFVTFLLFVRPALLRWQGARESTLPARRGILTEPLANHGDRRHFMRVFIAANGDTRPAGGQDSHMLASLAAANGLVDVPPQTSLPAGAPVNVLCWD
jgi:molybdopterin molybdotransferase